MKYQELIEPHNRVKPDRDGRPKGHVKSQVKTHDSEHMEASVGRLYDDLTRELESRLINIGPAQRRGR